MIEKTITIDSIEPVEIYGVNDVKLNVIKKFFPKLKIVARGYSIKALGEESEIAIFEKKLNMLVDYYHKNGILTDTVIERLLGQTGDNLIKAKEEAIGTDIILFGNNGLVIKARTENQKKMIASVNKNEMLFAVGPAGTGKTYTCSHIIVDLIKQGKKIGITSNSHKVIHNLLKRVEDVAKEKDVVFQGIKKSSNSNKDSFYEGTFIKSVTDTNNIPLEAILFAGTAWLFSDKYFAKNQLG